MTSTLILVRSLGHWLSSAPAEVITFAPRSRSGPPAEVPADVRSGLRSWQRTAAVWRMVAVIRRWGIVAVLVAAGLVALHRLVGALPLWLAIGLPVLVLVLGSVVIGRGVPTPAVIARLLDQHLGLREQVSSALETDQAQSPLVVRLRLRAESLLAQARQGWTVRPVRDAREWVILAAAVAALLLLYAVPAAPRATAPVAARPVKLAPPPSHLPPIHVAVASAPAPGPAPPALPTPAPGQAPAVRTNGQTSARGTSHHQAKTHRKNPKSGPPGVPGSASTIYSHGGNGPRTPHGQKIQGHANVQHGHVSSPGQQTRRGGTPLGSSSSPRGGHGSGGNKLRGTTSGKPGSGRGAKPQGHPSVTGKTRSNPYGGNPSVTHAVTKPGLVTGPALNSSTHAPGNAAGHGQGGKNGRPTRPHTAAGKGHQLRLKSPYAGASSGKRRTAGGSSGQKPGKTAQVHGGASGTGSTDYIPPDANNPAPAESGIIVRYFGSTSH